MRRFLIGLLAAIVLSVPLLAESSAAALLFNKGAVTISQGGRSAQLNVEIAGTPAARTRGLMGRDQLPENAGMFFVYKDSAPRVFWMKNTRIPLSIAFISNKFLIIEILDMAPPADNDNPPSYLSKDPARYALEVNRGWFNRHGFGVGARVKVE